MFVTLSIIYILFLTLKFDFFHTFLNLNVSNTCLFASATSNNVIIPSDSRCLAAGRISALTFLRFYSCYDEESKRSKKIGIMDIEQKQRGARERKSSNHLFHPSRWTIRDHLLTRQKNCKCLQGFSCGFRNAVLWVLLRHGCRIITTNPTSFQPHGQTEEW